MHTDSAVAKLPILVRSEFTKMDAVGQSQFLNAFSRKRKSLAATYFLSLLSLHYAYLGRIGMTLLMWLVGICTFGIGVVIWWFVDLFRIPDLVANKNGDIAIETLRDIRIIQG